MKLFKLFPMLLAGLAFTACSDSENIQQEPEQVWNRDGKGYMALNIQLPTTPQTRAANDKYDDGIASEYKVDNAVLLLFTGGSADNGSDATFDGSYVLTKKLMEDDVDNDNITTSYKATAQINKSLTGKVWGLVLLNYDNVFTQSTNTFGTNALTVGSSTVKDIQAFTTNATLSTADKFFMTNAVLSSVEGGYGATTAPKAENIRILSEIDPTKIYETEAAALENNHEAGSIFVERAVAKVTLSSVPTVVKRSGGSDLNINTVEWAVGNTESSTFIVRNMFDEKGTASNASDDVADYLGYTSGAFSTKSYYRFVGSTKIGTTTIQPEVNLYRTYWCVDPHYTGELTAKGNTTAVTYTGKTGSSYAPVYPYENTFNVEHQTYNNSTRVMFKVTLSSTETFYTINGSDAQATEAQAISAITDQLVLAENVKKAFKEKGSYTGVITSSALSVTLTTAAGKCTAVTSSLSTKKDVNGDGTDDLNDTQLADVNNVLKGLTTEVENANANVDIQRYNGGVMYYESRIRHFADPTDTGYSSGTWDTNSTDLAPWNKWESTKPSATTSYPGSDAEKNYLGRYGMVRNNWYDIEIDKIEHLGSPTDVSTTIGDEPDDNIEPDKKYLSVKINVLSWAKRTQKWSF